MLKSIFDFIDRHPLTTLIVLLLFVAAPQLLGVFALLILIPIVLLVVAYVVLMWKMRKMRRRMEDTLRNMHRNGGFGHTEARRQSSTDDGRVTIITSEQPDRRVSDDVGEYVDFKEIKEDKK